jgi:hypothetical protein
MIDMHQSRRLADRRLWSGTVQQLFRTLELDGRAAAPEISESLAVFCQNRAHMPARTLSLLMARSFCAAGDTEAAERILRHDRAHGPHTASWLEVLSADYPFPELYPLFSSRALHPQYFASAGTVWVLDFGKVRQTEADRHELIIFRTVRILTEQVSNVWKKSDGCGTLGVKGLSRLTQFVRNRRISCQLPGHLCAVLALRARRNGWTNVPEVLFFNP